MKCTLAKKYEDHWKNITFNRDMCGTIYTNIGVMPKLDGIRCIATKANGQVTLRSRTNKEFQASLTIIKEQLTKSMQDGQTVDGEIYIHGVNFQKLISLVKKDQPESESLEYHIFDTVSGLPFFNRVADYTAQFAGFSHLKPVCYKEAWNTQDIEDFHKENVAAGFEGSMIRKLLYNTYIHGRTDQLLKLKDWHDEEFEIIGGIAGKGKNAECCTYILKTSKGHEFKCVAPGNYTEKKAALINLDENIGKLLTIKFQEKTLKDIPRFPIGIGVRIDA